jgi:F-type H+-transporting ATPase subunit epsilon
MSALFRLEIVTPERVFFTGDVEMVVIKTLLGEMGVLKDHLPMVVAVSVGSVRILQDGGWLEAVLTEGFMEITHEKTVILTDTAEWPYEIDINRANAAIERAKERLQRKLSLIEYHRTQAAMARALARLRVTRDIK